jgi:LacI family transcriptional regulator
MPHVPQVQPKSVRLIDIAKAANLSVSVVGSVLNGGRGNSRVAQTTADRVLNLARELNYRPSPPAQQLRGKRSNVFGLLVASAGDPLTSFLVEHLDEQVVQHGCQTLIGNTAIAPGRFEACVDDFLNRGVDGIFCIVHSIFPGDRAKLLARCPKTVFYSDPGLPTATYVEVDQDAAGYASADYLLKSGRRRLGFAIDDPSVPLGKERIKGAKRALADHKRSSRDLADYRGPAGSAAPVRPDDRRVLWQTPDEILDDIVDKLVIRHRADAIIAHNDFLASALLKRLRQRGLGVPADVAVIGYLNHYLCEYVDPPLTSVDLCHQSAACAMVEAVHGMFEDAAGNSHQGKRISIEPIVVPRQSA